ncbi:nickel-dependent lactate racemase [Acidobacteriota bacterium]
MKEIFLDFGRKKVPVKIPGHAHILPMGKASLFPDPEKTIRQALKNPIKSFPLKKLAEQKIQSNPNTKAVIVISDCSRPVPYSGESGILFPLVDELMKAGLKPSQIRLLVATGTHRAMSVNELREFLDPRIFSLDLHIINHDCRNSEKLIPAGKTKLGGEILVNRYYVECDIKILTGLVESHFMAGVSGGRKSICPGLMCQRVINALHGGRILSSPKAADLILEENPVHEESLRVARMAGCDMIVNVTLDSNYKLTGVFAGDMEKAHLAAVERLRTYAAIPVEKKYDLVFSHAGFVGVNHYQAAKGALAASSIISENGICLLAAFHTDPDPIGSSNYKEMMHFLGKAGTNKFLDKILDDSWTFVPDQWEAQIWTRLFKITPPENLIYCSFEIPEKAFSWLPGTDARTLAPRAANLQELAEKSLEWAAEKLRRKLGREPFIAVLPDGPYGIPVYKKQA